MLEVVSDTLRHFELARSATVAVGLYLSLQVNQITGGLLFKSHIVKVVSFLCWITLIFNLKKLPYVLSVEVGVRYKPSDGIVGAHHLSYVNKDISPGKVILLLHLWHDALQLSLLKQTINLKLFNRVHITRAHRQVNS